MYVGLVPHPAIIEQICISMFLFKKLNNYFLNKKGMYLLEYKYVYQVILFKFHCLCLKINKLFY